MRPVKAPQRGLLAPLNRLLGTEANVRVLRVLAETREPLLRAEVARRAELAPSGVRRVLDQLIAEGIIEAVGAGARMPVRLRDAHPLASALRELFKAERQRIGDLARAVRKAAERLELPVPALWMVLPDGEGAGRALGAVRVVLFAGATRLRQSLPFPGVLSAAERERLLREAERDAQPA